MLVLQLRTVEPMSEVALRWTMEWTANGTATALSIVHFRATKATAMPDMPATTAKVTRRSSHRSRLTRRSARAPSPAMWTQISLQKPLALLLPPPRLTSSLLVLQARSTGMPAFRASWTLLQARPQRSYAARAPSSASRWSSCSTLNQLRRGWSPSLESQVRDARCKRATWAALQVGRNSSSGASFSSLRATHASCTVEMSLR
mmetsp:Transcript_5772/g.18348  ORF Transcript_5772/g.18348 Transcript_5772/m.18348 type:complete len:203 (-) Transcript_5772:1104-1712(-)